MSDFRLVHGKKKAFFSENGMFCEVGKGDCNLVVLVLSTSAYSFVLLFFFINVDIIMNVIIL